MLDFDLSSDLLENRSEDRIEITEFSSRDIGIIGIGLTFPQAASAPQFWQLLKNGVDCIRDFPQKRKEDTDRYLRFIHTPEKKIRYSPGAYLDRIDTFDNEFFHISRKEASLLDPNQKVFLETAWKAIEDAGYGGRKLKGSKTGVYVGFTDKFDYSRLIQEVEPESLILSETGNLSSIIAGRISYLLDFKGPSMLLDTACSSSLVAVHVACSALRNGECETALAGGVKISLLPLELQEKLGIESSDGKTKTFDETSDGTGFGEGCAVLLLKPLNQAVRDKDSIYAVIKGSSVNQDGRSIGITAPNAAAQEDVLVTAWQDARIDPETIGYIEAHGTGTSLGDPVEVKGLTRAFRRFSDKKQFCSLGSVKTNIGHLDNAAGIAGLVKMVLALKHKQLPPTLHFTIPNKNIKFIDSPLYVQDKLTGWSNKNAPLRCGVSSFGLSGTNCHVVLEEAPSLNNASHGKSSSNRIFTLSARKEQLLSAVVHDYLDFLKYNRGINLDDLCATVNNGRGHYNFRLAVHCSNIDDLYNKLSQITEEGLGQVKSEHICFGKHKVISDSKRDRAPYELYEHEKEALTLQAKQKIESGTFSGAVSSELIGLYARGAEIDWEKLYSSQCGKVHLPPYHFEKKRCWLDFKNRPKKELSHPLLDKCLARSLHQDIYIARLSVEADWILSEHEIMGNCLVPGTAYIEMARECCSSYFPDSVMEFRNILFIAPLVVKKGEQKQVHIILQKESDHYAFTVAGVPAGDGEQWVKHAEGQIYQEQNTLTSKDSLDVIRKRCTVNYTDSDEVRVRKKGNSASNFGLGKRWSEILKSLTIGENEVLAELKLPDEFKQDLYDYFLHPSMLDVAVNAITQTTGNGLYLPLSYGSLHILSPIEDRIFSHIRMSDKGKKSIETITFDVSIFNSEGKLLCIAEKVSAKRVNQAPKTDKVSGENHDLFHKISWVPGGAVSPAPEKEYEKVLLINNNTKLAGQMTRCLKDEGHCVLNSVPENEQAGMPDAHSLDILLKEGAAKGLSRIIYLFSIDIDEGEQRSCDSLINASKDFINLLKSVDSIFAGRDIEIILISDYVYCVTGKEKKINIFNTPLFALAQTADREYKHITCRCIDMDEKTTIKTILSGLFSKSAFPHIAYRKSVSYIKRFENIPRHKVVKTMLLKNEGCYIITGGLGGIGLEIAKHMAQQEKVNLVLINRTRLPGRDQWDKIVEQGDKEIIPKIKELLEIEAAGATVRIYPGDVSDDKKMSQILNEVRKEFGRINGVIHAAGVGEGQLLSTGSEKTLRDVFRPKIEGVLTLDKLTNSDELDFFVLFSSISSLYPIPGQAYYSAANAFLDTFSQYREKKGKSTLSLNWAAWNKVGMAKEYKIQQGLFKLLEKTTAVETFFQVLGSKNDGLVIGEVNYPLLLVNADSVGLQISSSIEKKLSQLKKRKPGQNKNQIRETLSPAEQKSHNSIQDTIARIWAEVLGEEKIDIYEKFSNLGGDSIIATNLLKKIEQVYPNTIDITDIFTYDTVFAMAGYIMGDDQIGSNSDGNIGEDQDLEFEIESILDSLEQGIISVGQAEKKLRLFG